MSYTFVENIYEGRHTYIHKAFKDEDKTPVIIKVLKNDHPVKDEIDSLEYEYNVMKDIDLPGVIKCYEFTKFKNNPAIVLEDFEAKSIDIILKYQRIDIKTFLELAIKISETIHNIHSLGIIHKDIKSQNILVNLEKQQIKIIDFGISKSIESLKNKENEINEELEGTLAYISPEQTGRINKNVDTRSDLYSLGVTLYEIITGLLPFRSNDQMELIHSHIAIDPVSPKEINSGIPEVISNVIMKLLAKDPDDRYQSALSLKKDLEKCFRQFVENNEIKIFDLDRLSKYGKLSLPEDKYNISNKIKLLSDVLEDIDENSKIALIKGYPGVGKTTIINEFKNTLLEKITSKEIYYISHKCSKDKDTLSIPEAFNTYIKRILSLNESSINQWRQRFSKIDGDNKLILTNYMKSFGVLNDIENSNSKTGDMVKAFADFVKTFADKPVIIVLDDSGFIDADSVKLIKTMLEEKPASIMIILACRTNRIEDNKPLSELIRDNNSIAVVKAEELTKSCINDMMLKTFSGIDNIIKRLVSILMKKTAGNPFYLKEFVNQAYDNKYISYDFDGKKWVFDLDKLNTMPITENVSFILEQKLNEISEDEKQCLSFASCMGINFDLKILSMLYKDKSVYDVSKLLFSLVSKGLITLKQGSSGKLMKNMTTDQDDIDYEEYIFAFLHERVKASSYEMLLDSDKMRNHYIIGKYYIDNFTDDELSDNILNVADHLNIAVDLVDDDSVLKRIIEINIKASKEARKAISLESAVDYLKKALDILPERFFETEHELYLKTNEHYIIMKSELKDFTGIDEHIKRLMDKSRSVEDKLYIYNIQLMKEINQENLDKVLEIGKEALELVDIEIPEGEENIKSAIEVNKKIVNEKLAGRTPEEIAKLPEMKEKKWKIVLNILNKISGYANRRRIILLDDLINILRFMVVLCNGNTKDSPIYYILYSVFLLLHDKNKEDAYKWGITAKNMADKSGDFYIIFQVYNQFASYINGIKNPPKSVIPIYERIYKLAVENGSFNNATVSLINMFIKTYSYISLEHLLKKVRQGLTLTGETKNVQFNIAFSIFEKIVLNLKGLTEDRKSYNTIELKESDLYKKIKDMNFGLGFLWYYQFKLENLFIYEEYEALEETINNLADIGIDSAQKLIKLNRYYLLTNLDKEKLTAEQLKTIEDYFGEMKANFKEEDYGSAVYFYFAQYHKVKGNVSEAIKNYDKAIQKAIEFENIKIKALSYQYAAKFFISIGSIYAAKHYMTEAYYSYKEWGADGVLDFLEEKYKDYIVFKIENKIGGSSTTTSSTYSTVTDSRDKASFDIESVMKLSQAITGEIILNKLLAKMMRIVVENAGAERGSLILPNNSGELRIEAELNLKTGEPEVLQSICIDNSDLLPEAILNYCYRNRELVLLSDAYNHPEYSSNAYIKQRKIKSLLCMPLINQGKISGLVYLENNLTKGSFTKNRLKTLKMLSSQIAVSIENAKLYHTLEETHRFKSAFYANMSHELRTPMNQINGIAEGLIFGTYDKTDEVLEELESITDILTSSDESVNEKHKQVIINNLNNLSELLEEDENIKGYVITELEKKIKKVYTDKALIEKLSETFGNIIELYEEENLEHLKSYKQIKKSGDHLTGLIDMLLNMTEVDNIEKSLNKDEIAIKDFCNNAFDEIKTFIKSNNKDGKIDISLSIDDELPETFTGDKNWTYKALRSILFNSIIFTDQGSVKFDVMKNNEDILFQVTDSGIGIKDEDKSKIFTEFGKTGYNKSLEGTGLSLAMAKRFINMQSGKIGFRSDFNKGSTFWFSLPIN